MSEKQITPRVATLRITSQCNRNCKCCFAPKNVPEMDFLTLKRVFRLLWNSGIKAVLLTGGEPLLRRDFPEVIGELRKYGFKIFLDTNADFFFKHKLLIARYVDTIGLPIAFADKSWDEGNFDNVLKCLEWLSQVKRRPVIRIGTVVTKENINELEAIGDLIKNYPVSIWKLYQFTPQAKNAVENRHALEISDRQFSTAANVIKKRFSRYFDVVISKRTSRNRAYFYIESDGRVVMPVDDMNTCRLKTVCQIFDKDVFRKWANWVSESCYIGNVETTFRCRP